MKAKSNKLLIKPISPSLIYFYNSDSQMRNRFLSDEVALSHLKGVSARTSDMVYDNLRTETNWGVWHLFRGVREYLRGSYES